MTTKSKTLGKRFWLLTTVLGLLIMVLSFVYFYIYSVQNTQESLLKIASYMKVQCDVYTHYNNGAETQALLRAVESNRLVQDKLDEDLSDGEEPEEEMLAQYAKQFWLHGILLIDAEGNEVCGYAKDAEIKDQLLPLLRKSAALDAEGYTAREYTQRFYLPDGGYINMAATAGKDAEGVLVTYYYITPECAKTFSLTIQSLLEGYQVSSEGTIMIVDDGQVIACNDTAQIGQSAADNEVVQSLKQAADSTHIIFIPEMHSYGVMCKQRDYYIYAYIADCVIFSSLPRDMFLVFLIYTFIIFLISLIIRRNEGQYLKKRLEQETAYKEQLLKEAKRADEANAEKTRFLQRMSHDIRTPINGICGMLEVAEYYANDLDKQAECRAKIKDSSHLLLELINEVLDMGKLESGEIQLEHQPFKLKEVLDEVTVVIEKLAEEQQITMSWEECDVRHWRLMGSVSHVKRLYMNIMSNAVKYNKKNGSILLKCRELPGGSDGQAVIEFTCQDTGIGMSEEYQKKIFEPFTQENADSRSRYGGSGLGLSIAKSLADCMQGTLTFESREGEGTTFVATIPFDIDVSSQNKERKAAPPKEISIKGYHILLAEDNELNMEIAEFILEKEGAVIEKAWNGKEAVEIFKESREGEFDAILMDMMMPEMDGYQATEAIRAMDREDAGGIPIIAMTANAFTEDRIKAREAGMNAYVSKPINPDKLIKVLYKLVSSGEILPSDSHKE